MLTELALDQVEGFLSGQRGWAYLGIISDSERCCNSAISDSDIPGRRITALLPSTIVRPLLRRPAVRGYCCCNRVVAAPASRISASSS